MGHLNAHSKAVEHLQKSGLSWPIRAFQKEGLNRTQQPENRDDGVDEYMKHIKHIENQSMNNYCFSHHEHNKDLKKYVKEFEKLQCQQRHNHFSLRLNRERSWLVLAICNFISVMSFGFKNIILQQHAKHPNDLLFSDGFLKFQFHGKAQAYTPHSPAADL